MSRQVVAPLLVLWFALPMSPAAAQDEPKPPGQYKRVHQNALKRIESGNVERAIADLEAFAAKYPADAETPFMLAAAYAQAGQKDRAVAAMQRAIKLGLPPGRFLAGPRELFNPIADEPAFKDVALSVINQPLHGPMVGNVTDTSATVWVRTNAEALVHLIVAPKDKPDQVSSTKPVKTTAETDFTTELTAQRLKPDTVYIYDVYIDETGFLDRGFQPKPGQTFRTAPRPGAKSTFTLAFGGGAGYVPFHEHMWTTIHKQKPDMLVLLGDNVYIDDPDSPWMQKYCYYRRGSRPEWRALLADTPVYTIWDDHDFGTNDCWGGPDIDDPKWKPDVFNVYKQNWVNPPYGSGEQPGCWYTFSRGDVDFIMLDGRYYRTNPRQADPSMLGPVQLAWLFDTLRQCKGTFKVLCSPVPWTYVAKGDSRDTWNGYKEERTLIFDFLTKERIEGVVLMSADRHRTDLWKIERDNDYALYEFNSSRLTNQHVHPEMKQAEFSYNKKQSFGLVTFDTTKADPTVTYAVMTIDGERVHAFELKRSQLK